jgi:hypothetical protein
MPAKLPGKWLPTIVNGQEIAAQGKGELSLRELAWIAVNNLSLLRWA